MRIINTSRNTTIADTVCVADTSLSRMVGLLGRKNIPAGEALVITRCRSIHMFFMRFSIDVLFIDKEDRVVGVVETIGPFQLSPLFFRARYAVELKCGTIQASRTQVGDQLEFRDANRPEDERKG